MGAIDKTNYQVETLRAGQPRAYADHLNEYLITVTRECYGKEGLSPWVQHGDVEANIKRDEAAREAGTMWGGLKPDEMRKSQRDWAKNLVRSLCGNFREKNDDDGRVDAEAYFYPTLSSLSIDHKAGTVRAVITRAYTG